MQPLKENQEIYCAYLIQEMMDATSENDKEIAYFIGVLQTLVTLSLQGMPINTKMSFKDENGLLRLAVESFLNELKTSQFNDDILKESIHDISVMDNEDFADLPKELKGYSILFFQSTRYKDFLITSNN